MLLQMALFCSFLWLSMETFWRRKWQPTECKLEASPQIMLKRLPSLLLNTTLHTVR